MSRISKVFVLILFFLFLIDVLCINSCKTSKKYYGVKRIFKYPLKGPAIVIGILSQDSPKDILNTFYPFRNFLEDSLKKPVKIKIFKDFNKYYQSIKEKKLDLLIMDPASYCEIRWKLHGYIIPLVKPDRGEGEIRSVFITKATSGIDKIFDAIGKKLALGDERSSFSYLIPLSMLKDVGLSLKDFKEVSTIKNQDRIALFVLIGEYDVGALSEPVARKYLKDGLKIIKQSESTPKFLIATRCDFKYKGLVKRLLLKRVNRSVLQSFEIKSFVPAEDRDFDYIRILIRNFKGKNYIEYHKNTIKVAILPLYSPLTIYKKFDPLMRYLSKKTGYEFKMVIPKDFKEFIKIVSKGKVQFAYENPYVYAIISRRRPLKVLAITVGEECVFNHEKRVCGGDTFRGVIIVKKDSKIHSLKDLKGKKIFIVSPYSAAGFLAQELLLEKKGFNVKKDFKFINTKRQEKVIIGVYKGEADAGFVRESALSVFSSEIDMSKIRILAFTDYLPNWPFCAVNVSPKLAKKVKYLLIHLKDKSVLKKANIKGFEPASDENYEYLKKLTRTFH